MVAGDVLAAHAAAADDDLVVLERQPGVDAHVAREEGVVRPGIDVDAAAVVALVDQGPGRLLVDGRRDGLYDARRAAIAGHQVAGGHAVCRVRSGRRKRTATPSSVSSRGLEAGAVADLGAGALDQELIEGVAPDVGRLALAGHEQRGHRRKVQGDAGVVPRAAAASIGDADRSCA